MLKLTTSAGTFGPYANIQTLGDRYRCDGGDLPFSVVGTGEVSAWTDADAPPEPPAPVPQVVTMRQARLALLSAGLLSTVLAAVANADQVVQIEWEYSQDIQRDWPTLVALTAAMGMTPEQVDALFILAATL